MKLSQEEYQKWFRIKCRLNAARLSFFIHRKEIWVCHFGLNVGHEQHGAGDSFVRPVLVLNTVSSDLMICLPLSSRIKQSKFHHSLEEVENLKMKSCVKLDQIRILDRKRFIRKVGVVPTKMFKEIAKKTKTLVLPVFSRSRNFDTSKEDIS